MLRRLWRPLRVSIRCDAKGRPEPQGVQVAALIERWVSIRCDAKGRPEPRELEYLATWCLNQFLFAVTRRVVRNLRYVLGVPQSARFYSL